MSHQTENLRLILGLKLRSLRQKRGQSLRQIAALAGVSVSYLSELEQGKKYPKPDKLLGLARALDVTYDDLVSLQVTEQLGPLKEAVSSEFLQEFPFDLFGLAREDLVRLIADSPEKAGPLIRTLVEVGRSYDLQVEHFLLSALRAYQQMHANYFGDLEQAAARFRRSEGWPRGEPMDKTALQAVLEGRWGYAIDEQTLISHTELAKFRSVFAEGDPPRLFVNGKLLSEQKAFILGREIGYRYLELGELARTSSWLKIESFAQVLNNFKASYFSGALLMDRATVGTDLQRLFRSPRWDGEALVDCMTRYRVTPEMFLYRMTELVPRLFGLERIFFLRFHRRLDSDSYALTKMFNLSGVQVPYGIGLKEHYCRRWPGLQLLADGALAAAPRRQRGTEPPAPRVAAQRSHFVSQDVEFFVISLARSMVLDPETVSSVSIGFLLDESFKRKVKFWGDPTVPRVEVDLTCERCPLSERECSDRAVAPSIFRLQQEQGRKERALAELIDS